MKNFRKRKYALKTKRLLIDNTKEFCKDTTLHGLKYIANRELNIFTRLFFGISFVLVVFASGYFISNVYQKWQNTPVIVGLSPVPTFITKSPFPAVTICNLNQARKSKATQLAMDSAEKAWLQILCNRNVTWKYPDITLNWSDFIKSVSQPCEKMLLSCHFGSVQYNCSRLFESVMTDEGLCCTFNMVHPAFLYIQRSSEIIANPQLEEFVPVDWNAEKGYPKILPPNYYPRTAAGTGESLGFTVVLDVELAEYYCSSANGAGFKIALHSPTEDPHIRETGLFLQAGYETKIRIEAIKAEASSDLRDVRKEYRQCIFNDESTLIYYSFYTKRNCEIECDARLLIKHCNCISYYLPKLDPNVSICGIKDISCVDTVWRQSQMPDSDMLECHDRCLPSCFDLTFQPDFFSAAISHNGFSIKHALIQNISNKYASESITVIHMYFKENTFRSSVKTQFIGITDFLSNTGGLLGLFTGFSFISFAEFIYYALIRPFQKSKHHQTIDVLNNPAIKDNMNRHQLQTRPTVDYTPNKKHRDFRMRLMRPPISVHIIQDNKIRSCATISKSLMKSLQNRIDTPPFPYHN